MQGSSQTFHDNSLIFGRGHQVTAECRAVRFGVAGGEASHASVGSVSGVHVCKLIAYLLMALKLPGGWHAADACLSEVVP